MLLSHIKYTFNTKLFFILAVVSEIISFGIRFSVMVSVIVRVTFF